MDHAQQRAWGKVGGLTAHARHSADEMLAGARAGFLERFRREVREYAAAHGETLTEPEIEARAARLRRAHMVRLAKASAVARRSRVEPR